MNYLVQQGIVNNRLTAKGYADAQPIADNKTDAGRKQNRRTEFKIIKK
jgi:outer membrane protein OmpA-like peptidoglycan-associated protein